MNKVNALDADVETRGRLQSFNPLSGSCCKKQVATAGTHGGGCGKLHLFYILILILILILNLLFHGYALKPKSKLYVKVYKYVDQLN